MLRKEPARKATSPGESGARAPRVDRRLTPRRPARRALVADDLLRLQTVGAPRFSPDGRRLLFVVTRVGEKNESESNLWMADLAGRDAARPFTNGKKDGRPAWSPDGETIAFVSGREKGCPQIALIGAAGGEARALTSFPEGTIASFKWSPRGDRLAVSFRPTAEEWTKSAVEARKEKGLSDPPRVLDDPYYRLDGDGSFDAQRFGLYLVDVATGSHRLLYAQDRLGLFSYDFAPDGRRLVVGTNRHRHAFAKAWTAEILLVDAGTGKARSLTGLPPGRKESVSWSPDGQRIAWASIPGDNGSFDAHNVHLFTARPDGKGVRDLLEGTDFCLLAPTISDAAEVEFTAVYRWTPDGKRLLLQLGWHGETHVAAVAARGGEVTLLSKGRRQHMLGDVAANGRRLALLVSDVSRPPEVHLADLPAGRASGPLATRALSDVNGALFAELLLPTPSEHWVRSADGSPVHLWALRPAGAPRRARRPAILEIHGGPHTQYGWTFFFEFQLLAAQGWTVFYSNPRGSKGYGQAFCDGNSGRWGSTDWQDLEAVLDFVRACPDVDASRLGVMGGSFGGYMTLWAVGHTDAFRAAIADRCVSNMVSMWGSSDLAIWPDAYFPGNTWDDTARLWAQSPLKFLGRCRTPTLLIHSEGDLRCNVAESEQVHTALSILGVPNRFVRYPRNTSHGLSRSGPPDMRLHRLGQIVSWWRRWFGK